MTSRLYRRLAHTFPARKVIAVLGVAVAAWAGLRFGDSILPAIVSAAEKAALFSAAVTMPEGSVTSLLERYQQEIQNSQEGDIVVSSSAVTEQPPIQETGGEPMETSDSLRIPQTLPRENQQEEPEEDIRVISYQNRGTILAQQYTGMDSGIYVKYGSGYIKNSTSLSNDQVRRILETPFSIDLGDTTQPEVLIYHTHATEAYEPYDSKVFDKTYNWRSTDNHNNMVAVGKKLAETLESQGIGVIHVETQHDNPSYNGAYDKSAETIRQCLEKYPSIKVILDVHRDAIQKDENTIVKAVADINGKKASQLMIIAGCDNDGSIGMPEWESNFRFAAALQNQIESMYSGLTRPVFFCYRKYNMDLCPNGALLEFGSHGNTLDESLYTAELVGNALAEMLLNSNGADNLIN